MPDSKSCLGTAETRAWSERVTEVKMMEIEYQTRLLYYCRSTKSGYSIRKVRE